MNVQEIIVGGIVIVCIYFISKRILHYIKRIRNNEPSCDGCGSDCGGCCHTYAQRYKNEKKHDFIEKNLENPCRIKK